MAVYQASKEITKFVISGLAAVAVDFVVYFALSQYLPLNLSKGLSFCSGMVVTYNLNKYWTWRKTDKNNRRLGLFTVLYLAAMFVNIGANAIAFKQLPDNLLNLTIQPHVGELIQLISVQIDKVAAFIIATLISATLTFLGQKFWLFKSA